MTNQTSSPAREESSAIFLQKEMQDILRVETGLHEEFAAMIAIALVRGWRKRAGGQRIYMPVPTDFESRNDAIRRDFHGSNPEEVCRKYGIKRSRLYQIIGNTTG